MVQSGLIDEDWLKQMRGWGLLSTPEEAEPITDPQVLVDRLREVIESREAVELRDTDLDIVRQYLAKREKGKLHVPNPEESGKTVPLPVEFCRTVLGEYVIPWTSESIRDLLTDEQTYLKVVGRPRIQFQEVRELFYDRQRAFVVCTPTEK
jgi:hypothetical protein